jgi:hypothetical protein
MDIRLATGAAIVFAIATASTGSSADSTIDADAPTSAHADLNADGGVDAADVAVMRAAFFTTDARADLNADGRVGFADLALLKAALTGTAVAQTGGGQAPRVFLVPETLSLRPGEAFDVEFWWDFTGEPTLGGGTDITWDWEAFDLIGITFDDNPDFDPGLTRCDDEPCTSRGMIDSIATGNFNGLAGDGPLLIATLSFAARADALDGTFAI